MIEVLGSDFVLAARLGGVSSRRTMWSYALRNALAPSIVVFALCLQYLVGGIVITETVFDYPGIGKLLVSAVNVRDINTVQSVALILAALYVTLNVCADVLVVLLVPRLRTRR
jgi:peptide/nickel transport system permease protein